MSNTGAGEVGTALEPHQRPHFRIHPLGRPVRFPHDLDIDVLHALEPAQHTVGVVGDQRTRRPSRTTTAASAAPAARAGAPAPRPRPRTPVHRGAPDALPPRAREAERRTPRLRPHLETGAWQAGVPDPTAAATRRIARRTRTRRRR